MNHYTYIINYPSGMKYIGVRSCKALPEEDTQYLGSSKIIPPEEKSGAIKTILKSFDTRLEAVKHECELHELHDVKNNSNYYNQVNQTSTKFDQKGCTKETHTHIQKMAEKLTGRSAETHNYIKEANIKRRAYSGDNKTDKQKQWHSSRSGVPQGPNPKKANKGIESPATKPWYYITPEFKYVEVHNSVDGYFRENPELLEVMNIRNIKYVLSQKPHEPITRGKMKGYTFGRLESKPEYLTQENLIIMLRCSVHCRLPDINKITVNKEITNRDEKGRIISTTLN
jgi:hypothetical protein